MKRNLMMTAAVLSIAAGGAMASTTAKSVTDLNLRAGPGPQHDIIGVIAHNDSAEIEGCLDTRDWCKVTYEGQSGWAYGKYLTASLDQNVIPIVATDAGVEIETVVYEETNQEDAVAGAGAVGAAAGALLGGPVGAVAGAIIGGAAGAAAEPPEERVVTYVRSNRVAPVYLEGEVVTGAVVPDSVDLTEIPDSELRYVYINGLPVLVDPNERAIVHIVR